MFRSSGSEGYVKLIDLTGMLTRGHILSPNDHIPSEQLKWDLRDLQKLEIPQVNTACLSQPNEAAPGTRHISYCADWWSIGVSKMQVLGLQKALFDGPEEETPARVLDKLRSGKLEEELREEVASLLRDEEGQETEVWVASILWNLRGRQSGTPLAPLLRACQHVAIE